ncbi:putative efflux protein, MATE family [Anaerovirgula multivorans]|uniref:Multidrug export protein MepA n=1 Tax=Anaerovirgula multivorans TaxID=312168 RepID=A0A239DF88_9FIRM|nr:MATE family efflux transporter [Anaerovirgula multivorans]SNS31065.1 putative efflux protein, MATE family [Anaerovirgula multivorans]
MQQQVSQATQLAKEFFKYLIPSVSAMWFFSIYTMIDGIFVGRGVGPLALAAVNLSMPYINTVFAISLLVAIGSSTLITFYLGQDEREKSNEIFTLNVIILSVLGITISVFSLIVLEEIAIFLGATEDTLLYVKDYLRIIIIFSTFFIVAYSLEVLVKADGFPIYSIIFVMLAALINILLDYILVIHLGYGVKGAALATGFSQLISCITFLIHFILGKSNLKFVKPKLNFTLIKSILTIGTPESLTELSTGFTTFAFNFVVIKYIGSYGLAAFSIIMYLNNLVLMTMIGVNQGMQPLISFYNGKNDYKSIKKLLQLALKTSLVFGLLFFVSSQLFTEQLVSLFIDTANKQALKISLVGLKIFSFGFLICGFNIIFSGYFTALKETKKATIISSLRGYILMCIVLFILPAAWGNFGIWVAPLFYEALSLSVTLVIYFKSKFALKETPYVSRN